MGKNKKLDEFELSKPKKIGRPYYIKSSIQVDCNENDQRIGVLALHGYRSTPAEVRQMSQFLAKSVDVVYAPRMAGHGTAPINLKDVTYKDWYESIQRAYAALRSSWDKVILVGFSTGGLICLLSCVKKNNKIDKLVSISSALKLKDIRAKIVGSVNIWNDLLDKFKIKKYQLDYIETPPENPQINYQHNYLKGVEELGKLMSDVNSNLDKVQVESLIMQAKNDPVVNPKSAKLIHDKIKSQFKQLIELNYNNHVIITNKNAEEFFIKISDFIQS